MSNIEHPFQRWIDDNGVIDVRFYPKNPSESSASTLLDGALMAITAYENGNCTPYEDNTVEREPSK